MKKITKVSAILKRIMKSPGVIRELFDEEAYYKTHVLKSYDMRSGLPRISLLDLFPGFDETVTPYSFLDGTSLPSDLALLKSFAATYKECRYFEIGTWRGESVANVAPLTAHAITMNLPDSRMLAAGLPPAYVDLHRFFSAGVQHVEHIQHDSLTFDYSTIKNRQDLVFIDGDHHYDNVKSDTANVFRHLVTDQSTVIWHDYAFSPESVRWAVLAGILDGCPPEKRKFLYHVSNTMCAIFTTRPVKSSASEPFQKPDKYFTVRITGHKL